MKEMKELIHDKVTQIGDSPLSDLPCPTSPPYPPPDPLLPPSYPPPTHLLTPPLSPAYHPPTPLTPSPPALPYKVIVATLSEIRMKNGKPAISIYDRSKCNLHINPSGKFIIGGPQGDAGLTGRKIIIDTYGGWGAYGGGAFSGSNPTKVHRSGAYACRWMAKSIVAAGLCERALVQLSYAIGVSKPLSLFVETYGTEVGGLSAEQITKVLKLEFDCRPGALAHDLTLRQPKYNVTAAYCHFGREPYVQGELKFFSWEDVVDLSKYAAMTSEQVDAELIEKKHIVLQKWVG